MIIAVLKKKMYTVSIICTIYGKHMTNHAAVIGFLTWFQFQII